MLFGDGEVLVEIEIEVNGAGPADDADTRVAECLAGDEARAGGIDLKYLKCVGVEPALGGALSGRESAVGEAVWTRGTFTAEVEKSCLQGG